jgi:hypothetical protein
MVAPDAVVLFGDGFSARRVVTHAFGQVFFYRFGYESAFSESDLEILRRKTPEGTISPGSIASLAAADGMAGFHQTSAMR